MKMRLLLTLAELAICFALPTFAQQKGAIDPQLMNAVLHSCQVFDNAFNNNDPEALANLFTEDATFVTDSGVLHGRDDILKYQIGVFKVVHFGSHKNVPISAYPIGTDGTQFWATGSWSHTVQVHGGEPTEQKGFWSAIIVNDGTGKHVMQTWNITPAPAPTTTPSPTSSKEEKNTIDPEVRQQIEALLVKGDEAFNKRDAAAFADWYTDDAVFVGGGGGSGPHYGRQSIEKRMALDMASFPEKVLQSHELLQVNQLGVDVVAISKLAVGQWKGYGLFTFVRDTEGWKIRMAYVSTLVGNNRSSEQWTCSALRRSSARDMMSFWAHGMGIISHGAPWLTSNALPTYPAYHADKPLEVGMVISIETELHHNTRGFIKLEDTVAITDTGWEAFGDEGWNICGS